MFYSEALLSKTGPLARVWLSSNMERKLSKTHILQASVKDSVEAIITPNQAPMALRLSGQLLLGVARIYSRKARYLLDDCNEALIKIKMAFRLSGNNDIPAGLHMPSRDALMLPDVLTEGDNLQMPPLPDASFLLSQYDDETILPRKRRAGSRDINLQEDFTGSQFLQNSIENNEEDLGLEPMDELDLGLDLGFGYDDFDPKAADQSIEIGRDAPAARGVEEDMISEADIQVPSKEIDVGERDTTLNLGFDNNDDGIILADDGDVDMFDIGNAPDVSALNQAPLIRPGRISESPLSDIDDAVAQQVEDEHNKNEPSQLFRPEEDETEETIIAAPQRARKQKFLLPDVSLQISNSTIKEQQKDRSKITQPESFLPRDPILLSLLELQKNGGFISSVLKDGQSSGWAPELRGLLSIDTIRNSNALKRKRDVGAADLENAEEQGPSKSPRLELGDEDEVAIGGDDAFGANTTIGPDGTILEIAGNDDEGILALNEDEENYQAESPGPNFDETTAPLVHPADSGPVSLGTKHAVHLLRDRFGSAAANSPEKRKKASVLFQDLLPERTTSRVDATKMFFEVLVLATKDAVKVEQQEGLLGAPIRVRGKRGLWGDWAEREAGGEIETLEEATAGPSGIGLERSMAVAVSA